MELIETISKNGLVDLIDNLVKIQRDNEYKKLLDFEVSEQLDQSIIDLGIHYQMLKRRKMMDPMSPRMQSIKPKNLFFHVKSQIQLPREPFQLKRQQSKSHLVSSSQVASEEDPHKKIPSIQAFNTNQEVQHGQQQHQQAMQINHSQTRRTMASNRIDNVIALNRGKSLNNFS